MANNKNLAINLTTNDDHLDCFAAERCYQAFMKWLEENRAKSLSAANLRLKVCQQCGHCCMGIPCTVKPDEIKPIASYLGLECRELFNKYMVIDKYDDTNEFIRIAKEGQSDIVGSILPRLRRFDRGYCVFFNKNTRLCNIYPVRPAEAKDWNCWERQSPDEYNHSVFAWNKGQAIRFMEHK
jgi:Fe-S-cluster containining protein